MLMSDVYIEKFARASKASKWEREQEVWIRKGKNTKGALSGFFKRSKIFKEPLLYKLEHARQRNVKDMLNKSSLGSMMTNLFPSILYTIM